MRWLRLTLIVFAVSLAGCSEPPIDEDPPEPYSEVMIQGMPEGPVIVDAKPTEDGDVGYE